MIPSLTIFKMASKNIVSGFETIKVKFDEKQDAYHVLYLKSHSVREEDKRTPSGRTLFVLNVPPYCSKVGAILLIKPCFSSSMSRNPLLSNTLLITNFFRLLFEPCLDAVGLFKVYISKSNLVKSVNSCLKRVSFQTK